MPSKSLPFYLALFIVAVSSSKNDANGQQINSQYTIDIKKDEYAVNKDFINIGTQKDPGGNSFSYTSRYLTRNDKPWFPLMGEMHFSRVNEKNWEEALIKMKSAGIQIVSTYVIWNHHEEEEGKFNFTGQRNLRTFLSLCKKYGLYAWLRIGPWAHAEARNGGFPDWLLKKHIPTRIDAPAYLNYSKIYFDKLAAQCKGAMFKDGGPVIGIQLENEMVFKADSLYQHMKTLKVLAIKAGFDVPYYSAFAAGPNNQDEFFYTTGGYPDSPWAQHTKQMRKGVYNISPLESDDDIGSDLFGKVDKKVQNNYPKISAELGAGMQKTYHRRVDVGANDIGALAYTRVASGMNGMGYFMFTGGANPAGSQTTLQESRLSNYPNDMPFINYDFQAPVGAMNIITDSYYQLQLLNQFITDYGQELVTMKAFFPAKKISGSYQKDTVQCSVRAKNGQGFIFLSNYRRHDRLPVVANFQLHINDAKGEHLVPEKPINFPSDGYTIWPYNLQMQGINLKYATAQPASILQHNGEICYVFATNNASEFVFDSAGLKDIKHANGATITKANGKVYVQVKADVTTVLHLQNLDNKNLSILVLPRAQALHSLKYQSGENSYLLWANSGTLLNAQGLFLEQIGDNPAGNKISVYPSANIISTAKQAQLNQAKPALVGQFVFSTAKQTASKLKITSFKDDVKQTANHDSVWALYAASKRFNPLQPGPLYQPKFISLPGQSLYDISIYTPAGTLIKDWLLTLSYQGDVMGLYQNKKLVYDQFNYNDSCKIRLSALGLSATEQLQLQILPLDKKYDIYVEDAMKQRVGNWIKPALTATSIQPVYWLPLQVLNK